MTAPAPEARVREAPSNGRLVRRLSLLDSMSLVVGTIVGTGVLLKAAVMTQLLGSPWAVLAAWLAAGVLTLFGALAYAELGAMMPEAGGEYVFLRAAFGDAVAFLYGWVRFTAGSGSLAALGVSFATFLSPLVSLGGPWLRVAHTVWGVPVHWSFGAPQAAAIVPILALAAINCAGVRAGGRVQVALATIKVLAVLGIVAGALAGARSGSWTHFAQPAPGGAVTLSAFGAALVGAVWAYSGWSYLPMAAGEIRNPGRNVPRALIGGTFIVIALYLGLNAAYFYALPAGTVASANSTLHPGASAVAALAVGSFLPTEATKLAALVFIIATLGTLNGGLLSNSRVLFAMARTRQFFPVFGRVTRRSHVPGWAIGAFAAWASVLATSGTYDQLSDLAVFAFMIFFALTVTALFRLRATQPARPRPYRVTGYPVVPAVYVVGTVWMIGNAIATAPAQAIAALAFLLLGVPVYAWFRARRARDDARAPAAPAPAAETLR
jgi:APA family basic amino acid/polyamine antiporter